jgi:tRNA pseudouridine55 synthase
MVKSNVAEGMILVNKPPGPTSHDIVDIARKRLKIRKIGHAGTLDPLAEGLLILLVGRYTKLFSKFSDFDKEYAGILKLGEVTSTGDSQGEIIKTGEYRNITQEQIKDAFASFAGESEQIPPMVSAVRINGKRLYNLARKGITVERKPRKINITSIGVDKINLPSVEFHLRCSKGTYVRKIAEDVGEKLSCGAHMTKILRLGIGPFNLADSVAPNEITLSSLRTASL